MNEHAPTTRPRPEQGGMPPAVRPSRYRKAAHVISYGLGAAGLIGLGVTLFQFYDGRAWFATLGASLTLIMLGGFLNPDGREEAMQRSGIMPTCFPPGSSAMSRMPPRSAPERGAGEHPTT